jgi:acyl-coenzyme A synthetase/AMP-(fatty) acid ligase
MVEMKTFCNQHLPVYMNPDVFVFIEVLPRTRSNKVDYQALIRRVQAEEKEKGLRRGQSSQP